MELTSFISAVGAGLTNVIMWVGKVVTALVSEGGQLNPLLALFGVGIAVSAFFSKCSIITRLASHPSI